MHLAPKPFLQVLAEGVVSQLLEPGLVNHLVVPPIVLFQYKPCGTTSQRASDVEFPSGRCGRDEKGEALQDGAGEGDGGARWSRFRQIPSRFWGMF
jgi:hypothetical protein